MDITDRGQESGSNHPLADERIRADVGGHEPLRILGLVVVGLDLDRSTFGSVYVTRTLRLSEHPLLGLRGSSPCPRYRTCHPRDRI